MASLFVAQRASDGPPQGVLVLCHGRGTSEQDLLPLADELDPQRRLVVVAPRAPLTLPGSPGYHWYRVPRVGYPDPETFAGARAQLAQLHDAIWAQTGLGPEQTVLGGFSMGTVMSYTLGLDPERPPVAGILALSGFIPTVGGWEPASADRSGMRVLIAHGRNDPVIDVGFARRARDLLSEAGLAVDYGESDAGHWIEASDVARARTWLAATLAVGPD